MRFHQIDDGHLHVENKAGSGRPVVLIHALGMDMRIWDDVMDALPEVPRLRYDLRGHGLSALGTDQSMTRQVADAIAVIEAAQLRGAILCGASAGGLVAQGVAAARPDLLGGLILCNTAAVIGDDETWNGRIAEIEAGGIEAIADATMERWFAAEWRAANAEALAGWRTMLTRCPPLGYMGLASAIRDTDFTGTSAVLGLPTLAIAGGHDGSVSVAEVEALAELIPGATLQVLDGSGHLPCIDAAPRLAELIEGFRAGLPAG